MFETIMQIVNIIKRDMMSVSKKFCKRIEITPQLTKSRMNAYTTRKKI